MKNFLNRLETCALKLALGAVEKCSREIIFFASFSNASVSFILDYLIVKIISLRKDEAVIARNITLLVK
jgi:hypothetical protein